jgi:diacylglycerol kinase family enzyme
MSRAKILILFPLVLLGGKHTFMREVEISPCKTVLLDYEGTRKICLDGNIFCWEGPLRFDILPKALAIAIK